MHVIYVNGINTSREEAEKNRYEIEGICHQRTKLIWNESASIATALLESFWGRWFFWLKSTKIAEEVKAKVEEYYPGSVHLVGHSQGCIIINNALRLMKPFDRSMIKVTFFAATNIYESKEPLYEYFINDADPVVDGLIGTGFVSLFRRLKPNTRMKGKIYMRRGMGHSFINDYLNHLPDFTGYDESNFYKLQNR